MKSALLFFGACCSPAAEGFSSHFRLWVQQGGLRYITAHVGIPAAPSRCSEHSTSLNWLVFPNGLRSASLSPVYRHVWKAPTTCCCFSIARSAVIFFHPLPSFARCSTSTQLFSPVLLSATTQLHIASSSNSSNTYLYFRTALPRRLTIISHPSFLGRCTRDPSGLDRYNRVEKKSRGQNCELITRKTPDGFPRTAGEPVFSQTVPNSSRDVLLGAVCRVLR